eukprot:CAMPEP_0117538404 /NCGR_PEP_ID=MMETSP0784-20121206/42462_1 /TAXON_ID=39447 /ORGANISM="" /LENGTH=474 /DNA_ID=CAMNT_0005335019 /DNA_START=16 /DNA_END=1437 /DNA_ORIENTATION=-
MWQMQSRSDLRMSLLGLFMLASRASAFAPLTCETAVVGGGWAGVYAAWRLTVDTQAVEPSALCLFEARSTIGGRTYSVVVDGLKLDVGAYRFGKRQHLPGDLILHRYNMSTVCYEPDCAPDPDLKQPLYRIVDEHGHNAGYSTPLFRMLSEMTAVGVRVFYKHVLTGVYSDAAVPGGSQLHFAGGATAFARKVLLNLPRGTLKRLDPKSSVFPAPDQLGFTILRNCTPCDAPGTPSHTELSVKVYAIYDDPWWLTKLNLTQGLFTSTGSDPPLVGRYHDGPVRRSDTGEIIGPGALEAVYTFSSRHPEISYYIPFAPSLALDPLSVTTDPALLAPLHQRLMDFHATVFAAVGFNASTIPQMRRVVLGVWTTDKLALLPGPASSNFHAQIGDACPAEQCLKGVSPEEYYDAVSSPNAVANVHVANNDFALTGYEGVSCCWAEQSLKPVERTLHKAWGLGKPQWLDAAYYADLVGA